MGQRTAHRFGRPAGLLLALLTMTLLSGCLDISMHTRLDTDGSGTLRLEVLLGEELVEAFGSFGEEVTSDDLVEDGETDLPAEFSERTRITPLDDGVGVSVEVDFNSIDELNLLLSDTTVEGASSDGLVDRVQFDADEDQVRFSADVGATDSFETDDEFAMLFGAMAEPTVSFSVELPGSIGETNADEVDGRTATWDLAAASGTTIFAESGTSTSLLDSPWLLAVVGLVGLLALVLLIIVITRLRRSSAPTAPASAAPGPRPTAPVAAAGWGATAAAAGPSAGPPPMPPAGLPPLSPTEPSPVAPPVATPPPAAPSAGWYPDPGGSGRQRWWDGTTWTDHLH